MPRFIAIFHLDEKALFCAPSLCDKSHYGQLPPGWAWCRLSDVSVVISDGDHQPPPQAPEGIPFLVISDVVNGVICFDKARFVNQKYYDSLAWSRKPQKGDVLFTVTGSYGVPIYVQNNKQFCFQRHIALIRPCIINSLFLSHFLASGNIRQQCDEKATGIAQKTVGLETLRNLYFPLPPLAEQHRIVSIIEMTSMIINEIRRNKADLKTAVTATKARILSLAICGKLVSQDPNDEPASVLLERIRTEREKLVKAGKIKRIKGESTIFRGDDNSYYKKIDGKEEILPEIPLTWVWVMMKDIGVYGSGKTPRVQELQTSGLYPYFKVSDMNTVGNELFLSLTESYVTSEYNGSTFPANSIAFPKNGGAVLTNKKRILTRESIVDLNTGVYTPTALLDFWYLYYFFTSIDFRYLFKGAVLPTLDRNVIELMAFPLPPLSEQRRIVTTIEATFAQLDCIAAMLS